MSMVLNTRYCGRDRQLLVQTNRNGFLYWGHVVVWVRWLRSGGEKVYAVPA